MSTVFEPLAAYAKMIQYSRESGLSDSVAWGNLMWLTAGRIADYFMLVDCCETITWTHDPVCYCEDFAAAQMTATELAEAELASSFAYWHMLPVRVQTLAIAEWLNGTAVDSPVFQATDEARRYVIERACHQHGYADSYDATFGYED
jgi:hypothetical protein